MPVIAAVRGAAVGAGYNLMLAADLRIVAEDARLISGFLRIGLHPGGGHFALLADAPVPRPPPRPACSTRRYRDCGRCSSAWPGRPCRQSRCRPAAELARRAAGTRS